LLWLALYSVCAAPYLSWRNFFFSEGDLTVIRRRKSEKEKASYTGVKEKAKSSIFGADVERWPWMQSQAVRLPLAKPDHDPTLTLNQEAVCVNYASGGAGILAASTIGPSLLSKLPRAVSANLLPLLRPRTRMLLL